MQIPWSEIGIGCVLIGALVGLADAPLPTIAPADAEAYEGRHVAIAGFADDIQVGVDSHRGIIVAAGHAVPFRAVGTVAPQVGEWVELQGTLHRNNGRLILAVQAEAWR